MNKIIVHDYDNILVRKMDGYHPPKFEVDAWCVGGETGILSLIHI
jgi:hypothetical protein